jgi:ornithine cyclodeaminase/alanine dehydrogenase-like protein (mu-crystallin family)
MPERPQGAAAMLHLDNEIIADVLTMEHTMAALRIGFSQMAEGEAAHVPRLELWSPAERSDAYYCLGSMAGTVNHYGITAIRIKSDVIFWPEGRRQEKFAVEPGTYCGFILLFSSANGEPIAMLNDGVLQRMRVGGSAGIAADHFANPDASSVGILGSGDMARTYLEAISLVRDIERVSVFSPTSANREAFAQEMTDKGLNVTAVATAEEAVRGAEIVVTATNSMGPTMEPDWIEDGALVLCVTRREIGPDLVDRCDNVLQLGDFSIDSGANVPNMEFPQSGAAGFVSGTDGERARLPWSHRAEARRFPSLIDVLVGEAPGRSRPDETVLFINTGLQGIQFAAVAAQAYQLARSRDLGEGMGQERFLQNIRD